MADPNPTWPTPSGRDVVLDRVLRGGRRRLMIHRLAIAGAVVAGGLATGVALGATDTVSVLGEGTIETGDGPAGLRPCPEMAPVASLTGGDRVFLTGRSDDGEWLQLRSPFDPADRLWIDADLVAGDDDVSALPVSSCGDVELTLTLPDGEVVVVTTTTTTTPDETTTTTTEPDETTTTASTVPGQTTQPTQPGATTTTQPQQPTPTTSTTTSTTQAPDNTGPTISNLTRSATTIRIPPGEFCDPGLPTTVQLGATVTDPSGVQQVRVIWRLTNADDTFTYDSGNQTMQHQGGNVYRRTLTETDLDQKPPDGTTAVLRWSVRATDNAGNQRTVAGPNVSAQSC